MFTLDADSDMIPDMPFASFVKQLGQSNDTGSSPELRGVLREIASRLDSSACVLWEPSLDFTYGRSGAAGKLYTIDSTLAEQVRVEHASIPADPIHDFSARYLRGDEDQAWHNDFLRCDFKSASRVLMQRLGLAKVCVALLDFGSLADKPGLQGIRGKRGLISVYRESGDAAFDAIHADRLAQLAEFIPPLYRILNDRNILGLFQEVRRAYHPNDPSTLDEVCALIGKTFRCLEVSIFLRPTEGSSREFKLLGTTYPRDRINCPRYIGEKSEGLTGWVLHERTPVLIPDLSRFEQQKTELDKLYPGIRWNDSGGTRKNVPRLLNRQPNDPLPPVSFMACPIQSQPPTELFGCIRCAIGTDPYYFSWRELNILENIAAFIGEPWAQESEKELWHNFLESVDRQSEVFHQQIALGDYNRPSLYRKAADFVARQSLRGCRIVSFRMRANRGAAQLSLLALNAAPEVYPPTQLEVFLKRPKAFKIDAGHKSIASRLMQSATAGQIFDLNEEGDPEEQEFFRAAPYVLSTPVMINEHRYGVFDLAFAKKDDLEVVGPKIMGFANLFARNLALHESRAEQHQHLKELLATQTEGYANVSHQLRSPLRTVVRRIKNLSEKLRNPDWQRGYAVEHELPIILGQANKALRVTSLLDFLAKISRGQEVETNIRAHPIHHLWKIIIESLLDQRNAVGRLRSVDFDAKQFDDYRQEHDKVQVRLDLALAEQVVDAIIGNAFKYSRRRENVVVVAEMEGGRFIVKVISRGVHLSAEAARLCTQKFWRSDEAKEVDVDGSGLGLYLTSLMMEMQGGSLTPVPTTTDGNTCMVLSFPVVST